MKKMITLLVILALSAIANTMSAQRVVVDGMVTEWTGRGNEYYYGPVGSGRLDVIYIRPFEQMDIQFYADEVLYGVELYRDGYFFMTNYGMYICDNNGYVHKVNKMPKYGCTSGIRFAYCGSYYNYAGIGRYAGVYGGYGYGCGSPHSGVGRIVHSTVDGAVIGGTIGSSIGGAVGTIVGITNAIKGRKARKAIEEGYYTNSRTTSTTRTGIRVTSHTR